MRANVVMRPSRVHSDPIRARRHPVQGKRHTVALHEETTPMCDEDMARIEFLGELLTPVHDALQSHLFDAMLLNRGTPSERSLEPHPAAHLYASRKSPSPARKRWRPMIGLYVIVPQRDRFTPC